MKMSVDLEMTRRMAKAAQIRIAPDEEEGMMDSINDILDFCAPVGELDTSGTPDFTWRMIKRQSRRADEPQAWMDRDALRSSAPAADGEFFRVPRIISEG